MNLAPELLSDLRRKAEALRERDTALTLADFQEAATHDVVLALLDRIEALQNEATTRARNDRVSLEQLAHALGWKDGGPGWQAAIDAVTAQKERIDALEHERDEARRALVQDSGALPIVRFTKDVTKK